jgi:hypothetical protein
LETYAQTKKLYRWEIRTSKNDSAFIYFTLESNEGLCFYSTLDQSLGTPYRDLEIYCPIEWRENVQNLLDHICTTTPFQVLAEDTIMDT